ncbi:copper chaperone [Amorphus suaedae]
MITLIVSGMDCRSCGGAVREAVHSVDPAADVDVDIEEGRVDIDTPAPLERFILAIERAGFNVEH